MAANGWLMIDETGKDAINFDGKTSTIKYCVTGTDILSEANAWVVANSGETYFSMPRETINHQRVATNVWFFDVVYSGKASVILENNSGPNPTNSALDFQFETILEQFHIDVGLDETVYVQTPLAVADFDNVIGLSSQPDQPPQGMQIATGVSRWTETYKTPVSWVTGSYELLIDNLTGKINNAAFRGRDAQCVQFLGIRSRASSTEYIETSYHFEYRRPRTDYTVGGIEVPSKAGFQIEEVIYSTEKDETSKRIKRTPQYVRIIDVYEQGDFSTLGIGTAARP